MNTIVSRLDIAHLFCELDDFYQHFEHSWQHQVQLPSMSGERRSHSYLTLHNFLVNLLAGLIAYTYQEKKPSLDLECKGLPELPPAIF